MIFAKAVERIRGLGHSVKNSPVPLVRVDQGVTNIEADRKSIAAQSFGTDVESSSRWYQRLLGCRGAHGGRQYEQLVKDGSLILQLHSFEVEHHHGAIGNRADRPYGNGVLLWFEVDDFDAVMQRASEMNLEIVLARHRNPPDGDGGPNHWECWMRDPDGYTVVVASPYGTADGDWRPGPDLFT
jgi:catechol 2,3-dioxygenase-like lactoylglutathione lyase family enzyme